MDTMEIVAVYQKSEIMREAARLLEDHARTLKEYDAYLVEPTYKAILLAYEVAAVQCRLLALHLEDVDDWPF